MSTPTPRNKTLQEGEKKIEKYIVSLNKEIGRGSYATVYQGRRISDDLITAVKVIDKKIFSNNYNVKSIQSQIDIMKKLDHDNVVKLLDVYQTNNNMYIVTEYCQDGDLRSYIKKKNKLGEIEAVRVLKDLINGFKYLYSNEVIHRDLKPANILINDGVYKISDFGFAKNLEFGENTILRSIVGTPLYMSPQILSKQSYTNKSDLWSIGLIFYEMIYGQTPWPANNEIQLLNNIKCRNVPFDSHISESSKDFIKRCLKIKEEERMSWQQAFNHPVLSINTEQCSKPYRAALKLTPRQNKQNHYFTNASRQRSKNKSPCIGKNRSRTPLKHHQELVVRNITPKKLQTPKNIKYTPDRQHSPWRM